MSGGDSIRGKAAIVGVGQTEFARSSQESDWELALRAGIAAAEDAGIDPGEIDGIVRFGYDNVTEGMIVRGLGIRELNYYGEIGFGSLAQCAIVAHAAMAIATGQASTVLIYRALNQNSDERYGRAERHLDQDGEVLRAMGEKAPGGQFAAPYGYLAPGQGYAMAAHRYQFVHGLSEDELAKILGTIAVGQRAYANRNPAAMMHDKTLSMSDYLDSRIISSPLRRHDYCLESVGAGAIIIVSAERARSLRPDPVHILAATQSMVPYSEPTPTYLRDLAALGSADAAQRLYDMAQIQPDDLAAAMLYDAFTPLVLFQMEAYALAPVGAGWRTLLDRGLGLDSGMPINTHGGMLSEGYLHGFNHLVEAVRQLRETAVNQIRRDGPILVGGHMMSSAILSR